MAHIINFTPGPSQLYFTVPDHLRAALREGIPSISHRSRRFETIFHETTAGLRELLAIPDNYAVYFTASATEIWERIVQNLVEQSSAHLVNGAFSRRFYETARQLGKSPAIIEAAPGQGFENEITLPPATELLAVTHNETSTGVSLPVDYLRALKEKNPDTLVAIDAVSSLPYPALDYSQADTVFFSVQKGFGLPAGLGVWLVNEKCHARAAALLSRGHTIGSYHSLPALHEHAVNNQTPETPNVLAIYLLGRVVQDMLARGLTTIRRETDYKAAILYQVLNNHPLIRPFVTQKEFQSKTVVTAHCGNHLPAVTQALAASGIQPGDGYGSFKQQHLRFANFPTHSKEQVERLVDVLQAIR